LGVSDLEVITAKKIRRALQELFSIDLTAYKVSIYVYDMVAMVAVVI
jgi:hypothetical protein